VAAANVLKKSRESRMSNPGEAGGESPETVQEVENSVNALANLRNLLLEVSLPLYSCTPIANLDFAHLLPLQQC
jgi:hypothetical protein